MKYFVVLLATLTFPINNDVLAQSQRINLTACNAWPNERTGDNDPSHAIDQDTETFTWCTAMYNTSVGCIGIAFQKSTQVARIRLWKDDDGTGWPTPSAKDLVILVTTDEGPVEQRNWTRVTGLVGHFKGAEVFHADSIGTDGFVWGDVHDSVNEGDGWGSLVFDPITATGVCIQFTNSAGATLEYMHYKVHEFEAYEFGPDPTRATSWGQIKSLYRQ